MADTEKPAKTLADEMGAENELQRRRFVHLTRPRGPLSAQEAIDLHKRMEGSSDSDT